MQQKDIEKIVREVIQRMGQSAPVQSSSLPSLAEGKSGIFENLKQAVSAATIAQKQLSTVACRNKVVAAIRQTALEYSRELAEMAVTETGMGRVEDKIKKNNLQALFTPGTEILYPAAISGDNGLTLIENAPWGVIASVTPSTNPAATVINNAISMTAAGNSVIFAPHPAAKNVCQYTIQILNQAIEKAVGIKNLLVAVKEPSIDVAKQLFSYPGIHLLVVTGGEAVVDVAKKHTDKRLIAAGAGNPPVVVDETADLQRAAQSIYDGASFDNNIICADEKEIIAVDSIADALLEQLKLCGATEISLEQAEKVAALVFNNYPENPSVNAKWVGRNADIIAREAGLTIPKESRLMVVDVKSDVMHPFAQIEQMMPIIPLIRAQNVDEAIDIALQLEHGYSHTAGMHSTNIDHMDKMAKKMNTSLFVKNGPHLAGLGAGGEGWTSMTISTPTGEGVTNARTFVRLRRCALVDNFRII